MSKRELGRVEVLARVRSKQLRLVDAATLMHKNDSVKLGEHVGHTVTITGVVSNA